MFRNEPEGGRMFGVSLLQFIFALSDARTNERCIPPPALFICCNQADRAAFVHHFWTHNTVPRKEPVHDNLRGAVRGDYVEAGFFHFALRANKSPRRCELVLL